MCCCLPYPCNILRRRFGNLTSRVDALYSVQTAVFLPAPATVSHQDDSPLLWRKAATESNTLTCDVCADDLAMPTELQGLIAEMNWDV